MKPNILICGMNQFDITDLISCATPAGTIAEDDDSGKTENNDAARDLVRRVIETPIADFIEATEFFSFDSDDVYPETIGDYAKKVEAELEAKSLLNKKDGKIDVIWYCTGGEPDIMEESEEDFIRSAAGIPNALIVACPTIITSRAEFKESIDNLASIAGRKRIVLAPSVGLGDVSMSVSAGTLYLVEKTKQLYLDQAVVSDDEKKAYVTAWTDFYSQMLNDWKEEREESVTTCIEQAAGRALFILEKKEDVKLSDLIEEGVSLLGKLVNILQDKDEEENSKTGQTEVVSSAALTNNIVSLIYEIAACHGVAATKPDVELILYHSDASDLPEDAAAITYAVGMVAKACFEPDIEYSSEELKAIFRTSREDGKKKKFKPFDDDNPFDFLDEEDGFDDEESSES